MTGWVTLGGCSYAGDCAQVRLLPDGALDVRAAIRDRIERGIRALNPDAPDPEQLAEIALSALSDGAEWLMTLAEEYQQRAHAAEKELAELRAERRPQ